MKPPKSTSTMSYRVLVTVIFGSALFNSRSHAQLLTETFLSVDSLSNLTYKAAVKEKDLFSNKIAKDTLNASFAWSTGKELFKIAGSEVQEIYDGSKLIQLDLNNLTYRMTNGAGNSVFRRNSLPFIIGAIKKDITGDLPVKLQRDSVVNGKECLHMEITELDTVKKGKRVYRIIKVLVDKKSRFPIYYRSEQRGYIDGTDMFVYTYAEIHFYDHQWNQEGFTGISAFAVPSSFVMEKPTHLKPLLAKGTKAPELNLADTNGGKFLLRKQKGKVVLLNFTTTSCPHSIESISMLNALYSTYGNRNFTIATINPYDDKEAIEMYNKQGKIKYPVFINSGTDNTGNYNVDSYPTFYLIDKNGHVIKGVSSYYKSLNEELDSLIRNHL